MFQKYQQLAFTNPSVTINTCDLSPDFHNINPGEVDVHVLLQNVLINKDSFN